MTELFTDKQLSRLRAEFGCIKTIDPCAPTYSQICKMLDVMPLAQLRQVSKANIRFLSKLAVNRISRKERVS